jgi:hypothetical protein
MLGVGFHLLSHVGGQLLNKAVLGQGFVANDAEARKTSKYSALAANYTFTPIAIETLEALGSEASAFFSELGRRLQYATREHRAYMFLMQCISVAVQRGNAACLLGSLPPCTRWDDFFVNLLVFVCIVCCLFLIIKTRRAI